jgi:hypothetical protein
LHRRFRAGSENQRHPVARRETNELTFRVGNSELFRLEYNCSQLSESFALLRNQQLGVGNDIDELNVAYLEAKAGLFSSHGRSLLFSDLRREISHDFLESASHRPVMLPPFPPIP